MRKFHSLPPISAIGAVAMALAASMAFAAEPAQARERQVTDVPALAQSPGAASWPHLVQGQGGSALVHQPQVISWPDRQTLNTRIALALTATGAKSAVLGTIEASFATSTDLAARQVTLSNARLTRATFPAADPAQAHRYEERIRAALAAMPEKRVPLNMVLASLRDEPPAAASAPPALRNEPPRIFVSQRPASLLVFDGEPVLAPVPATPLSVAVNTNWDVFFDGESKAWYWLNNGAWLRAAEVTGPWAPAGALPPSLSTLPSDRNFADVRKQIPGRSLAAADMPTVFVSTTPAEVIVIDGAPKFAPISGTQLQYVSNTGSPLFRHQGDGQFYFLVSGRWFAAPGLQGPWVFATAQLPQDFQRIPANGPFAFVLPSVPGTPQAQRALQQAQIPQQATLNKSTAKLEVAYAGPPKFEPIPGTTMAFAVNTSFNVVQAEGAYYACYQGAWFVAPSPAGAWVLAPSVPAVVYTIPPASPLYPCTYVRVYAATPTTVTFGYTAGYTMAYVSYGVVVYGTGYYYPPYVYPAPIPVFYPYPVTYGAATYYNPATGAWARGGAVYGPYYGARGGTAYNPSTGAWARGGSVYGPYGGAGAFSAYNPSTGSYAHGSAVYGPDGAAGNASWYNARTGVSGSTQQNADAYGRWGSSTISGTNQTVHTQSQSNARGSAGSFSSSTGAEGAAVKGASGNTAGAVKTSSGDVYAGADGNVYKKTDSGWQKYDDGSWNQVQKPTQTAQGGGTQSRTTPAAATNNAAAGTRTPPANGGRAQGFEHSAQLERDHQARLSGAQRSAARTGGGSGFRR